MTARKRAKTTRDAERLLGDWNGFFEEMQAESPRAAVMIVGAFLDAHLRRLLANFMIDHPKEVDELLGSEEKLDRPLSSFSSRTRAAYCLGFLNDNEFHDLTLIRKIRNRFAHELHGFSFDDARIVSWCESLRIPEKLNPVMPEIVASHGGRFLLAVVLLLIGLSTREAEALRIRRTRPAAAKPPRGVRVVEPAAAPSVKSEGTA